MKNSLLIGLALLITTSVMQAQENQEKQRLTRAEKKELRKQEQENMQKLVAGLITNRTFVLEASYLITRYGAMIPVSSTINFISIDSTNATFQFGSANHFGQNGVGGVTIDGKISDWIVKTRKKTGVYYIRATLSSAWGAFDINFDISPTGMADATITSNYGGILQYSGRILAPNESRIFKGMAL